MNTLKKLVNYFVGTVCLVVVIIEELTGFRFFEREFDKAPK